MVHKETVAFITDAEGEDGEEQEIRARRGVVIASGGFEKNLEMREKWQRAPITVEASGELEGLTAALRSTDGSDALILTHVVAAAIVIPTVARAKITCRLVPDQEPKAVTAAIARHLREHCPPGVTLEINTDDVPEGY